MKSVERCYLHYICFFILIWALPPLYSVSTEPNFERRTQPFVLSSKQIHVPGYPDAFNPSIVRWRGKLLMYFRSLSPYLYPTRSDVGFVWLDENFNVNSAPYILEGQVEDFNSEGVVTTQAEDMRLITIDERLFMIYNDNRNIDEEIFSRKIHMAEIDFQDDKFITKSVQRFDHYEMSDPLGIEKNWTPFDYQGSMLLIYSLKPHLIFMPSSSGNSCETIAKTFPQIGWRWGELRGGTPALKIDDKRYLAFFDSMGRMRSVLSGGKVLYHYFMGAYTFSTSPPFEILEISRGPIIGKGFYAQNPKVSNRTPKLVVYPSGYVYDDKYMWVSIGKHDFESWVVKIDRKGLMKSLVPVNSEF